MVELFRPQPMLAAWYLRHVFGEPIPDSDRAHTESCDFTDVGPKEFRGDGAFALYDPVGRAQAGICVEIQRGKDDARHWKWPVYLATLRARLQCPTYLLVVAPDRDVAAWCRRPIALGHPGLVLHPLVLGPDRIPAITDLAEAIAAPEQAVLSALAHGDGPAGEFVLAATLVALRKTEGELGRMYYDMVASALSGEAKRRWEELMKTYEYQSEFARRYVAEGRAEGKAEGKAEGEAQALLLVLEARGVPVTENARRRITTCSDLDQLGRWLRRAATVDTAEELFDETEAAG
ncbi:hypothetical protein NDR87_11310 [Nocardia sp. CDC159]|uniref:hypothetical protein n=1 Tax=Nocardia sp. CDC159 TaxID=2951409 RepID=UPI0020746A1B|nr:hypothetical protein [Nocardia sp. CDC159]MCM6786947.1 hypothetical protein [Nocardia sp. CDC159]